MIEMKLGTTLSQATTEKTFNKSHIKHKWKLI